MSSSITTSRHGRRTGPGATSSSRPGGCDFAADPSLPATIAPVFWALSSTSVVAATALPNALATPAHALPSWPPAQAERLAAGERHILFGPDAQLAILGPADLTQPLAFLIPAAADLPERLDALLAFWRHLSGGPPRQDVTSQRRRRLILGLRALDGRAAGTSYRSLAAGLYGADRVPSGTAWKSHDLRSRTLRLVTDATALMRGGYRSLAGLLPNAA